MADNTNSLHLASVLGVLQARDRGSYGPPAKRKRIDHGSESMQKASEIADQRVTAEQALR
jgi:hypothetical protein